MKKALFFTLLLATVLCLPVTTIMGKRTTVIVSLDGFRWDYPLWYDTPFLDFMASKGVSSGLIPSYPSKTFPNHYTMATGLYPDHHGIIANEFYDKNSGELFSLGKAEQKLNPIFYGGEPIWNTAQRQGKHVAVFYWPGSDVKVNGSYPDIYYPYDHPDRLTLIQRCEGVLQQLQLPAQQRPDLIMAYMEHPDAEGHHFGPQGWQTRAAVHLVDSLLHQLYESIQQLPIAQDINLIVVSDHGMTWVAEGNGVRIEPYLKPHWVKFISGTVPCNIYAEDGYRDSIYLALRNIAHASVWRRQEIPAYLHYGSNPRVGDVVVSPDLGYYITDKEVKASGTHGFDPYMLDMQAVFRAIGPDFRHTEIPHFKNVDIYPLLCRLLGVTPARNDGDLKEIDTILYQNE